MGTRCLVGKLNEDNTITFIYVHYDGYPTGVGKILFEHYTKIENVNELLNLGDLSSLGPIPTSCPNVWDNIPGDYQGCVAYSDRGEDNCDAQTCDNKEVYFDCARNCWVDYVYLYKDNKWYCGTVGSKTIHLSPLTKMYIEC